MHCYAIVYHLCVTNSNSNIIDLLSDTQFLSNLLVHLIYAENEITTSLSLIQSQLLEVFRHSSEISVECIYGVYEKKMVAPMVMASLRANNLIYHFTCFAIDCYY